MQQLIVFRFQGHSASWRCCRKKGPCLRQRFPSCKSGCAVIAPGQPQEMLCMLPTPGIAITLLPTVELWKIVHWRSSSCVHFAAKRTWSSLTLRDTTGASGVVKFDAIALPNELLRFADTPSHWLCHGWKQAEKQHAAWMIPWCDVRVLSKDIWDLIWNRKSQVFPRSGFFP